MTIKLQSYVSHKTQWIRCGFGHEEMGNVDSPSESSSMFICNQPSIALTQHIQY